MVCSFVCGDWDFRIRSDFLVLVRGFGVWGLGFGVWDLGFGVFGFEFWVWGLEFGVRGLGLEVGGLGFRGSTQKVVRAWSPLCRDALELAGR